MLKMMSTLDDITGPINLGNPDEFTILELAEKIIKQTNSRSKLIFKPLPQDDPTQRKPDISLAIKTLEGWRPKVKLDDGLVPTIEYFKQMLKN
jgi:UDP-glucuronate decarboxylase